MLSDIANIVVDGSNADQIISAELFNNNFTTCLAIEFSELKDSWKTYSTFNVAEGRIRLQPATKVDIFSFFHWTRERISLGEDSASVYFNVAKMNDIIESYNTHKQWTHDASNMAKNEMPKSFTHKMEWMEWASTLLDFLKLQPRRNGVPLNYVVRDNEATITRTNANFLDNYIDRTLLTGRAFSYNASKLHSYIVQLISENSVSEKKIFPYKDSSDIRVNFMALKEYYEGVGANAKSIPTAERNLQDLFYSGEDTPHIWWDGF